MLPIFGYEALVFFSLIAFSETINKLRDKIILTIKRVRRLLHDV